MYFIYFKLIGGSFPHITTKEYNVILNTFNVISSIYDKYKPNDRKSFLNYSFDLKKLLIMLGKVECAKCIPQLKTHSKQKELERMWEPITKDRESQVTYGKGLLINMQKLVLGHICQILLHKRVKIGRITQLLVLNPVELIFLRNSHVIFHTHARKKLEIDLKTASCST